MYQKEIVRETRKLTEVEFEHGHSDYFDIADGGRIFVGHFSAVHAEILHGLTAGHCT